MLIACAAHRVIKRSPQRLPITGQAQLILMSRDPFVVMLKSAPVITGASPSAEIIILIAHFKGD